MKIPKTKIRPYEPSDMPVLKEWFYSGDYPQFFRDMLLMTEDQLKIYSSMRDGMAYIVEKAGTPVGFMVIYDMRYVPSNLKVAILIDKKYQGQKYALSGMIETCKYVYNCLSYNKLIVEVCSTNKHLQESLNIGGFDYEATLLKEARIDGEWVDVIRYCMFADKFREVMNSLGG